MEENQTMNLVWQLLEVLVYLGGLVLLVVLWTRISGRRGGNEENRVSLTWANGKKVVPEDLKPQDRIVREWGEVLRFMRKADPDEYRVGVEEWLFKPEDKTNPIIVGLTREDFETIRLIDGD